MPSSRYHTVVAAAVMAYRTLRAPSKGRQGGLLCALRALRMHHVTEPGVTESVAAHPRDSEEPLGGEGAGRFPLARLAVRHTTGSGSTFTCAQAPKVRLGLAVMMMVARPGW